MHTGLGAHTIFDPSKRGHNSRATQKPAILRVKNGDIYFFFQSVVVVVVTRARVMPMCGVPKTKGARAHAFLSVYYCCFGRIALLHPLHELTTQPRARFY